MFWYILEFKIEEEKIEGKLFLKYGLSFVENKLYVSTKLLLKRSSKTKNI